MGQTLAEVQRIIEARRPVQHCVINPGKVVMMRDDARLRDIVASCELVNADGQAVVWAARLLGRPLPERVAGVDLFAELLGLAEWRAFSVFFLGAREEVVHAVAKRAQREHPQLHIAGWRNGYWKLDESKAMVAEVMTAGPDILFVGMPSPKKEYWLAENLEALGVPFSMGVGGSFDVYAGQTKRAPAWMQRIGLEWLCRLTQEPRRMWRRYLIGNLSFLHIVVQEYLHNVLKRAGQE